jgi:hypothetical protein
MPGSSRHLRGWVRYIDVDPAAGHHDQLAVELRLADIRGHEEYAHWLSAHYLGGQLVDSLDIRFGDDVEVRLETDPQGRYTKGSFVMNYTRGVRYTLAKNGGRGWKLWRPWERG